MFMHARKLTGPSDLKMFTLDGSWGWKIVKELQPLPSDRSIHIKKYRGSAFIGTNFDILLRNSGAQTLIFTGVLTEGCVESTARDALHFDYFSVHAKDYVDSLDKLDHDLIQVLQVGDTPTVVREVAAFALGAYNDDHVIATLIKALKYEDIEDRAIQALVAIGEPAIEPLLGALEESHEMLRPSIILALAKTIKSSLDSDDYEHIQRGISGAKNSYCALNFKWACVMRDKNGNMGSKFPIYEFLVVVSDTAL